MIQASNINVTLRDTMWAIPAVVPLLVIFLAYFIGVWDWGLMDDHGRALRPGSFNPIDLVGFGEFRPVFSAYAAVFYRLFNNWVIGFYIFKLFLVVLTLCIWGFLASRITRESISFWLVPAVTLSFYYFYDAIFYLSSHEVIGLLFLGIALHCFLSAICSQNNTQSRKVTWLLQIGGLLFLLLAFFSKEPFVSSGIGIGIGYLYLGLCWNFRSGRREKNRNCLVMAICLIGLSLSYGFFLMFSIRGGHSSRYDPSDLGRMFDVLHIWLMKDFVNHLPWILGSIWILFTFRDSSRGKNLVFRWASVGAGCIYLGYLLLLLPWNTATYYAAPLGLFFGFFLSLILAKPLLGLKMTGQYAAVLASLMLNTLVCLYGLHRELIYQYDTSNLLQWARVTIEEEQYDFSSVGTNAMEPADAIPNLLKLKWGIGIPRFDFVRLPSPDRHHLFFYSPRFSSLQNCQRWSFYPTTLSRIGINDGKSVCYGIEQYKILMASANWIVFGLKKDI